MNAELALYIARKHAASENAKRMVLPDDFVIDIFELEARPSWLNGVPLCIDLITNQVYRGSKCLEFMASRFETYQNTKKEVSEGTLVLPTRLQQDTIKERENASLSTEKQEEKEKEKEQEEVDENMMNIEL